MVIRTELAQKDFRIAKERRTPETRSAHVEVFQFFQPLLQKIEAAYFPLNGPVQVNHKGIKDMQGYRADLQQGSQEFIPAKTYLTEAGVSQDIISGLLTEDGKWKGLEKDPTDIWNLSSSEQAADFMARKGRLIDAAVSASANHSLEPYGFNEHRGRHWFEVSQEANYLLHHAGFYRQDISQETHINTTIAAMSHDWGLLLGRGPHSLLSALLLVRQIPGIDSNDRFATVAGSVIAHDPPRLKEFLAPLGAVMLDGTIDPDIAVEVMLRVLPPEALALIGADRNQFNRGRVPVSTHTIEAFEKDPNIFPNLVWEAQPIITDKTYSMHMFFNPFIDPRGEFGWSGRESKRAPYLGRRRVHVPNHMQENLKRFGIPYSITAEQDWVKHYKNDYLTIQMAAVFALNPHLQEFKLVIHDQNMPDALSKREKLKLRVHTFHRGQLRKDLEKYQKELDSFGKGN